MYRTPGTQKSADQATPATGSLLVPPTELLPRQREVAPPGTTPGAILGVDGGATKTVAAVLGLESRQLSVGRAGPSNPHSVGFDAASRSIAYAINEALASAHLEARDLEGAVLGIASADLPSECEHLEHGIPLLASIPRRTIVNDVLIAWASGTLAQAGVAVISGTGSNCFGVDEHGAAWRCGGWGHILGDEGAGYSIGLQALRAIVRYRDGRGPWSILTPMILERCKVGSVEVLASTVYESFGKADIADLATVVVAAATDGDSLAAEILSDAGRELAQQVLVTCQHLQFETAFPVATVGSAFNAGEWLLKPLEEAIKGEQPKAMLIKPRLSPIGGALWLAARLAGREQLMGEDWLNDLLMR